jgi:hypothetical protein
MTVHLADKVLKKVKGKYDRIIRVLMYAERELRKEILSSVEKDDVLKACCKDAILYLKDLIRRVKIYHNDINALTKIKPLEERI